jgi:hypothetical protein
MIKLQQTGYVRYNKQHVNDIQRDCCKDVDIPSFEIRHLEALKIMRSFFFQLLSDDKGAFLIMYH